MQVIGVHTMAAINQIVEMLRSHFEGDDERFRTAVLQLAANEARMGHDEAAATIQRLLEKGNKAQQANRMRASLGDGPFAANELAGLMDAVEPAFGLKQMVLSAALRRRLERIVKEQQHANQLCEYNLTPRHRLLLLGPSGCGKTMTAHALAHDLALPLYVVRLDALFTKYLGETATKLRLVFETIERQHAVFLFDEFDSLGLARGSQHDVAEMRRVLNSFLVFIDSMRGNSIVIAASNHPDALDVALFRRFDDIIEYGLPSRKEVELLMKRRLLQEKDSDINWSKVLGAMQGMTFAEAERVASEAIKERIIEGLPCVSTPLLLSALADRRRLSRPTKA